MNKEYTEGVHSITLAKVYLSKKYNVWRVLQGGDVLSEWKTKEVADAYCEGYNAALDEMDKMENVA